MFNIVLDEEMEMPCLCDCGQWFDLNDGHSSLKPGSKRVVCPPCHRIEEKQFDEIEALEIEINRLENEPGHHKREINRLREKLTELQQQF